MRGTMPKRFSPRGIERRQGAGPAECSPRDRFCLLVRMAYLLISCSTVSTAQEEQNGDMSNL